VIRHASRGGTAGRFRNLGPERDNLEVRSFHVHS